MKGGEHLGRYLRQGPYSFTREAIHRIPAKPGVYVLYNVAGCVLAHSAVNLQREIAEVFAEPSECVKQHWPTAAEIDFCHPTEFETRMTLLRHSLDVHGAAPLCGSES